MKYDIGLPTVYREDIDESWTNSNGNEIDLDTRQNATDWWINVVATNRETGETRSRNMTCFPILTYDQSKEWGPYTDISVKDTFDESDNNDQIILLEENWTEPYDSWIESPDMGEWNTIWIPTQGWVTLREAWRRGIHSEVKGAILMDNFTETRFMSPPGMYKPVWSINGSEGNWIKQKMSQGYDVTASCYQNHEWTSVNSSNVIGEIPGDSSDVVVVGAHYDGWWNQGATDNAVAVGAMLGIAKYFDENRITPHYTLKFIAFGGEDYYQRGSKDYVKEHIKNGNENVVKMINMDMFADLNATYPLNLTATNQSLADQALDLAQMLDYTDRTSYDVISYPTVASATDGKIFENEGSLVIGQGRYPSKLYHRDGDNHNAGDVFNMIDRNDLNVSAEVALAIVMDAALDGSDSKPPNSSVDQLSYWHTSSPITVTATATDNTSGVCKMRLEYRYRANNNTNWSSYSQYGNTLYRSPWEWEFDFPNGPGFYRLISVATDYVGNTESISMQGLALPYDVEIGYDTTDPTITDNQTGDDTWRNSNDGTYDVDFSDSMSGIDKIWVKESSSSWDVLVNLDGAANYTNNWSLPNTTWGSMFQGKNYVDVKVRDMAGRENTEVWPNSVFWVKKDTYPPWQWHGFYPAGWVNDLTPDCSIDVSDITSGPDTNTAEYRYSLDNGSNWSDWTSCTANGSGGTVTLTATNVSFNNGTQNLIKYRIDDFAGNTGTSLNRTVKIDMVPPVTTASLNPSSPDGDNGWYMSNVTVTLNASDSDSGVDLTEYKLDAGNWTDYISPVQISDNGNHILRYRSTDNASNQEDASNVTFKIDRQAPDISNVTASPSPQQPTNVNITCTVSDIISGIDGVTVNVTRPDSSYSNVSMNPAGAHGYYHADEYTLGGTYSYRVWATDQAGKTAASEIGEFTVETINHTFDLCEGWTLITVPVENDYTASSLGENITNCSVVAMWNASSQSFHSFVVGTSPPSSDFAIKDGVSYFVYVNASTTFSVTGVPLSTVSVDIYEGWNTIGWFREAATNASTLGNSILNCSVVAYWNTSGQHFHSFVMGISPPSSDFAITQGRGVYVYTTSPSTWNGTAGGGYENRGTGEEGSMSMPHPVYGYAYYQSKQGITPATGAAVAVENNRTGEQLKTIVEDGGIYQFELSDMDWRDNDEIIVTIYGTGDYQGFTGSGSVIADDSRAYQQVEDIYLTK